MIYKLAKTTPLLSGQVRWDMCLSYVDDQPTVESLHIVPINDDITYNEGNARETYNYPHTDNIKRLYKTIGGNFFSTAGKFDSKYPIYNNGKLIDPFDHTYRCGCKRMNRYSRYNRQFSYLCPMWISEAIDYSKLIFRITLQDSDPVATRVPRRDNYITNVRLGDDFIKYITEYMGDSSNGEAVGDELVNIKFEPILASISGIQASTGHYQVIDTSSILSDLLVRERPLMDFDSLIVGLFEQNSIIAQQLINFNLVFNINDICPEITAHAFDNHAFNVKVDVLYDGKLVEMRDLYTNYTHIPPYSTITRQYDNSKNVLDYLRDNMGIEYAYKNKSQQCIFHWSLLENPKVLYNMYDGFGPIIQTEAGEQRLCGRYSNQSNIQAREYSISQNNIEWCRYVYTSDADQTIEIDNIPVNYPDSVSWLDLTKTPEGIYWFNNNKFKIDDPTPMSPKGCVLVITPNDAKTRQFTSSGLCFNFGGTHPLVIKKLNGDVYAFICSDKNRLTLGNIHDDIVNQTPNQFVDFLSNIKKLFEGWVSPYKIEFYKSVVPFKVPLNLSYSDMVEYRKRDDSIHTYVYRYTGKLIPYFIPIDDEHLKNYEFYYKQWCSIDDKYPAQDIDISSYNELILQKYLPEYFKLDSNFEIERDSFYSLNSIVSKSTQPEWYRTNHAKYSTWRGDVSWLNDNRIWNLTPTIETSIVKPTSTSNDDIMADAWDTLYQYFGSIGLNISSQLHDSSIEEWCRDWIYSKYKMSVVTEYANNGQDINNIYCKIKFNLS